MIFNKSQMKIANFTSIRLAQLVTAFVYDSETSSSFFRNVFKIYVWRASKNTSKRTSARDEEYLSKYIFFGS